MDILKQVEKIADTPVNVLITGETGTGKELIAKSLHYNSARSTGPFIALNCTAIPDSIIESELFGIEKGVATGVERRIGRIEQANGGTLFLDEIGDMPLGSQAKILRVLEERELVRVGGKRPIPVDIRVIAATNKDLRHEVEQGAFRKDLYFRLNVVHLQIPPLRERQEDIPLLMKTFLEMHAHRMGRRPLPCSHEAMECLKIYTWPGNVRELEHEAERLVALASSPTITREDLSYEIRQAEATRFSGQFNSGDDLRKREKELILKTLAGSVGNKTEAARRLGISREGLRKKIKRYGIA
jgi:transcriptional regulator with PAS, ATPase and Fis domain